MTGIASLRRGLCFGALLAGILAAAACGERRSQPVEGAAGAGTQSAEPTRFRYELLDDVSGYYMPIAEYRAGDWVLRNIFMGQPTDFTSWGSGTRSVIFAPIMLEFEDVTSPMVATEIGETRERQTRILPLRYAINAEAVTFEGQDPVLGRVTLSARLDQDALATSRRNLGDDGAVLVGRLRVGERNFESVGFRWWAGD